jgi:hypothetical protein
MTAVSSSTAVTSSEPIVEKTKTRVAKSREAGLNHALLEQMIFIGPITYEYRREDRK